MGKQKQKPDENTVLHIRPGPALLATIDMLVTQEERQHPGRTVTRADVVRELLHEGLASRKGSR